MFFTHTIINELVFYNTFCVRKEFIQFQLNERYAIAKMSARKKNTASIAYCGMCYEMHWEIVDKIYAFN